jgi:tetratricopeptide (TPR) repeat protein
VAQLPSACRIEICNRRIVFGWASVNPERAGNGAPYSGALSPSPASQHGRIPAVNKRLCSPPLRQGPWGYGICLATCGQPDKGLPFLAKATELRPKNLAYLLNLARAGLDAKQFRLAKSALEKASALAPEDPAVLQVRYKHCWLGEDYVSARQIMLRLKQIAPTDENARWLYSVEEELRAARENQASNSLG